MMGLDPEPSGMESPPGKRSSEILGPMCGDRCRSRPQWSGTSTTGG
uniref:Uncharacterized protein n=1 Tax=Arundo donax TaxID=35708 RepID=A0A0A9EM99_ARUDO